jgi:hypothetical protein
MPQSVYGYFFRYSQQKQVVVILMTLALMPLALIPLELQRCLSNDAVANKDVDLLIWLAALYVGALLLSAGIKLAIRIQRVLISAQIVHTLRRSVFYCIYTIPPSKIKASANGWDVVGEGEVGAIVAFVSGLERLGRPIRELVSSYSSITDARMRNGILLRSFPSHVGADDSVPIRQMIGAGSELYSESCGSRI